jgi:hypothetical protein
VRWDELFDDMEAQLGEAERADLHAEVTDRTRREVALLHLVDRLRPAVGRVVSFRLLGAGQVEGQLTTVGPDWILLAEIGGREALVASAGVMSVGGLGAQTAPPQSENAIATRLSLAFALRAITRDRSGVVLTLIDGSTVAGTPDRIGADFLEMAEHPQGEPRRWNQVRGVRTCPLSAISVIRRE